MPLQDLEVRACTACSAKFVPHPNPKRRSSLCPECHRERNRITTIRYRNRKAKKIGLSPERKEKLLQKQAGRCLLCRREKELVVDHCHRYEMFRGLLCSKCNVGLGMFEDRIRPMFRALFYIGSARVRGYVTVQIQNFIKLVAKTLHLRLD